MYFLLATLFLLPSPTITHPLRFEPATVPSWNFIALGPKPGYATILNSCHYPLHVYSKPPQNPLGITSLIPDTNATILPGAIHEEELHPAYSSSDVSFQVSRNPKSATQATEFNYMLTAEGSVTYWMSVMHCTNPINKYDADACPGHEAGLQAVGSDGKQGCDVLRCMPGQICMDTVTYTLSNPSRDVQCQKGAGVAFEACAGLRPFGGYYNQ
ncbi:hypothetical protein BCR34DRAFT_598489 [Clohesyomyces aquaticus]|uniref:Uncharacterized protein n=1 Tax=Clohesyomyces aquaticus TaxID=1231657 RepID=A0A1Y1ZYB8_9PLEO|nr:hypothetical protein BCR34DRAFT_598489 [Clohesyomyces aquaticus]